MESPTLRQHRTACRYRATLLHQAPYARSETTVAMAWTRRPRRIQHGSQRTAKSSKPRHPSVLFSTSRMAPAGPKPWPAARAAPWAANTRGRGRSGAAGSQQPPLGPGHFLNRQPQDLETPKRAHRTHRCPRIDDPTPRGRQGNAGAPTGWTTCRDAPQGPDPTAELESQDGGSQCSCG